jgi:acetyl esterase/lipase
MKITIALILLALTGAAETFTYRRVGSLEIRADVHRGPGEGVRPVILWIHGGALIMGNRHNLAESRQKHLDDYLRSGFVVVSIDYRLAPETKLSKIWEDVAAAYQRIRRDGPRLFQADPLRIAVIGHSAGGYLTLLAGARLRPPPRALVSWYGYGDIAADWYARPDAFYNRQPAVSRAEALAAVGGTPIAEPAPKNSRGRFYLYTRQQGLWPKLVAGFDPVTERAQLDQYCPLRLVRRGYPPAMLLHGDEDTDVPFDQSRLMSEELRRQGVAHEFVAMPGMGHGFDRAMDDPRVADAFEKSLRFLTGRLK